MTSRTFTVRDTYTTQDGVKMVRFWDENRQPRTAVTTEDLEEGDSFRVEDGRAIALRARA